MLSFRDLIPTDPVIVLVIAGLAIASIWVWSIAIEKFLLYRRTRRAMDSFEQAFWSGQSLDELYRTLGSRPNHSMAASYSSRRPNAPPAIRSERGNHIRALAGTTTPRSSSAPIGCGAVASSRLTVTPGALRLTQNAVRPPDRSEGSVEANTVA